MTNKITAWSYSRLSVYEQCPLKFKFKFIDKLDEPVSLAMLNGRKVHTLGEDYLKGRRGVLPKEYKTFSHEMRHLKKVGAFAEDRWAFDKHLGILDDYFDSKVWLRVIPDVYFTGNDSLTIIDFKTGKKYGSYDDQMSLFSVAGFALFEGIETVRTELWFLNTGECVAQSYSLSQFKMMLKQWRARVRPLFNDRVFAPKRNKFCYNCHFRKDNGGQCPY